MTKGKRYKVTFELRTDCVLPLICKTDRETEVRWWGQFFTPIRKAIDAQYKAFTTGVQIANYSIEEIKEE